MPLGHVHSLLLLVPRALALRMQVGRRLHQPVGLDEFAALKATVEDMLPRLQLLGRHQQQHIHHQAHARPLRHPHVHAPSTFLDDMGHHGALLR